MKKISFILFCCISASLLSQSDMKINDGFLFSVEGTEGCGKTTLIKNVLEKLLTMTSQVITTREPGATQLGTTLRTMLMDRVVKPCTLSEFLLFAADRAQHFQEFIIPYLNKNYIIISDRMADSSLVYQGYVKGLDQEMISAVNQWAMQYHKPNLVFYLKIDPITALERIHARNEGFLAFEEEILKKKYELVQGYDLILLNRSDVVVLDANKSPEFLANQMVKVILDYIAYYDQE
jgi:dTMP kinase